MALKLRTPKRKWITVNQYVNLANINGLPCYQGHLSCAAWDGGPCMDELLTALEAGELTQAMLVEPPGTGD